MSAKSLQLSRITAQRANDFVRRHHYSGKVVRNSQIHVGVFFDGRLEGALQFGPPLDRSKLLGLVTGSIPANLLELNRMVLSDTAPRNSESRAIAVAFRLLQRHAPLVKWVVSFADATRCGDGTIYRASGFVLTGIKRNANLARLPNGLIIHKMTLESGPNRPRSEAGGASYFDITAGRYHFDTYVQALGGQIIPGYQLRYVRFVDESWRSRLAIDPIPFDEIRRVGAGMYRGERVGSIDSDAPVHPDRKEDGATPIPALQ